MQAKSKMAGQGWILLRIFQWDGHVSTALQGHLTGGLNLEVEIAEVLRLVGELPEASKVRKTTGYCKLWAEVDATRRFATSTLAPHRWSMTRIPSCQSRLIGEGSITLVVATTGLDQSFQ